MLRLLFTIVLSIWPSVLAAQWKAGFLGGLSSSHVPGESLGSRLGGQGGLLFSAGSDHRVSVEMDVYFAMKGTGSRKVESNTPTNTVIRRQTDTENDTTVSSIHLDYAEIPFLVRINFLGDRLHLLGGASAAIRLSCAITLTSNFQVIRDSDCEQSGDPLVTDTDVSAAGGMGVKLSSFELNLRAVGSLADITRSGATFNERFGNMTYSITGRLPFLNSAPKNTHSETSSDP